MCRVRRVHTESVLKEKMVRCVKVNLTSCVCFEVCKVLLGVYFCVDCYPEIPARICKSYFELVERIISIVRDGNNHVSEQAALAELTARLYSRKHKD